MSAARRPARAAAPLQRPGTALHLLPDRPDVEGGAEPADYEDALAQSARRAENPAPLSLYVHLPFCEKLCYFCGCTVVITGTRHVPGRSDYLDLVEREIDWVAAQARRGAPTVVQLHWGGGTPTYFPPGAARASRAASSRASRSTPDAEIGIEVDPRVTTREQLETLARLGFNRLSMGVQDFDPRVQAAINRIQPEVETRRLVAQARALGFASVNMDLIYGLPHQTAGHLRGDDRLRARDRPGPARGLLVRERPLDEEAPGRPRAAPARRADEVRDLPHGARAVHGGGLRIHRHGPLRAARRTSWRWRGATATLHRNFQGYTTKAGTDLIGFGMSAIGSIGDHYVQNRRELRAYREAVASRARPPSAGSA